VIRTLFLAASCAFLAHPQDAPKPIDPAKKAAIAHLLVSMHATDLMNQQMQMMAPSVIKLLKANPDFAPEFADEFGRRFVSQVTTDAVVQIVTQGYADHFSMEEIKDLTAFYDSPAGKKLVELQPSIVADVVKKSQEYGQKLGMKITQDILKEHPEYYKRHTSQGAAVPPPPPPPPL
jgi:hypothetical protein